MSIKNQLVKFKGFTLVELMIVVSIVGILASIAIPSYSQYVTRANRLDATTIIFQLAQAQEKYFASNLRYAVSTQDLGYPEVFTSDEGYYTVTIAGKAADGATDCDARCQGFLITATAVKGGRMASDECAEFTLVSNGTRAAVDKDDTDLTDTCW